jgi:isoprenylcysteine carboxyl methyltransferase (ICMT) family protein YpbQ
MVLIDSLYVLFSYVEKDGEIWTVAFALTKDHKKIT